MVSKDESCGGSAVAEAGVVGGAVVGALVTGCQPDGVALPGCVFCWKAASGEAVIKVITKQKFERAFSSQVSNSETVFVPMSRSQVGAC